MYSKEILGLTEARVAVEAALLEASKEPERPVSVAVVDYWGDLVYAARMEGAFPFSIQTAINKAYTAARVQRDTAAFADLQRERGRELTAWCDSRLTSLRGGLCIIKPGEDYIVKSEKRGSVVGGIGVSGRAVEDDEMIAAAGLAAIKF